MKASAGFKLMTNRFVTDTLTYPLHDAVLLHIRRRNHFSVKLYLILLFLCHIIEVSHTTLIEDRYYLVNSLPSDIVHECSYYGLQTDIPSEKHRIHLRQPSVFGPLRQKPFASAEAPHI